MCVGLNTFILYVLNSDGLNSSYKKASNERPFTIIFSVWHIWSNIVTSRAVSELSPANNELKAERKKIFHGLLFTHKNCIQSCAESKQKPKEEVKNSLAAIELSLFPLRCCFFLWLWMSISYSMLTQYFHTNLKRVWDLATEMDMHLTVQTDTRTVNKTKQ